ncbi:cytochrome P450 [Aaosphaeria arxii CBS 175.79]|uniref:Cytochrome P450 n=1 Tax=Aaosphaeria arxii CBS 175.79 TaxID=1450172 RepID=A0A6A5XNI3_9PLEO|nr:cytochrome P450 [Aaosphaeria arxii CBS 175.79]KAF2014331.1 cytochrome P450 [Aaosphaeria arxii CBS 175.79]
MGNAALFAVGTFVVFCTSIGLVVALRKYRRRNALLPLPPGPRGIPILGNVNDMPKKDELEWQHWLKHKDNYGPISSVTVLGQTMIIINDASIAFELLRDRSNINSSRPHQTFSGDIVGWNSSTALSQYNSYLKLHRKNITKVVGSNISIAMFDRVQETEAAHFLLNVLANPEDLSAHIRREAGTVILKIIYGYSAESHGHDPFIDLVGRAMNIFVESSVPGKWAIDLYHSVSFSSSYPVFPTNRILTWYNVVKYLPEGFPGTEYRKIGREMRAVVDQCVAQPYAFVKQQMRKKRAKTSFLSQANQDFGTDPEMDYAHKWAAVSMFGAGADTTVSSLMTFFLAMTLYPEVQRKAQEEIDRVIGQDRLPVAADKNSLPYIYALMLETHRWHSIVPMALPHASTTEDIYKGYRIPKGAVFLPNIWWFTHDPSVYPDPMSFNPDRFLKTDGHVPEPDPRNYVFGFGRRICPGRYVADNALFITIAQSLAVFDIKPDGALPKVAFESGAISHPVPYRTSIKPRSELHRALIEKSLKKYPWEESDSKELLDIKW